MSKLIMLLFGRVGGWLKMALGGSVVLLVASLYISNAKLRDSLSDTSRELTAITQTLDRIEVRQGLQQELEDSKVLLSVELNSSIASLQKVNDEYIINIKEYFDAKENDDCDYIDPELDRLLKQTE